jgi:hypothetical protein
MIIKKSYNRRMRAKTAVALACVTGGLGCTVGAGYEGLHYSAWANPGALNYMVQLAGAALVLLAVPAAVAVIWFCRQLAAQARALGLSPAQAAAAEFAVMTLVHHEWAKHNREWSASLTDSVMGPVREQQWHGGE